MKKILIMLSISFAGLAAMAQAPIGIHVGGNLASATIKEDGTGISFSPDSKFGLLAGVVIEVPVVSSLMFRPEINFIQKGYKISISENIGGMNYEIEEKATLNYVEVPLNFSYHFPAGNNQVFIGAGPSFGYGISGKVKSKDNSSGVTIEEEDKVNFGGDENEDDLKALDMGINLHGGFKLNNGMFIKAGYNFGLSNLSHDSEASYKNKGVFFSIGYMFSKNERFSKDF